MSRPLPSCPPFTAYLRVYLHSTAPTNPWRSSTGRYLPSSRIIISISIIIIIIASNQPYLPPLSQFYSSDDLNRFMSLVGLPPASIPAEHVFGDLPNDSSHPGGEAQLDVEYIMVRNDSLRDGC